MAVAKTAATAPEPDVGAKRKIPDRLDKNSTNSGGGSDDGSDDGSGGGIDDGIGDGSGGVSGVRSGGGCGGCAGAEVERKVSPRTREEKRQR